MRMILQRSGKVKSFESILTLEWFSGNRPDLVELFKFIKENNNSATVESLKILMGQVPDFVVQGVIDYLKNNGYIHPYGLLSPKGNKVIETGKVPVEEKGQFKIYYIEDAILENYLLHFERGDQIKSERLEYLDTSLYQEKLFHSVIDECEFQIKEFAGMNKGAYVSEESGSYQIKWDIDLSRDIPSKLYVSGEIKESKDSKPLKYAYQEVEGEIQLDPHQLINIIIQKVKKTGMEWNQGKQILLVPLEYVSEQELEKLTTSLKVPELKNMGSLGGFEPTEINMIPIGPINSMEAKKWVITLAKKFLRDEYKSSAELKIYLDELKNHLAFSSYENVFDDLTIDEILNDIRKKEDYQSYWNLQAPLDLFLELDERFIVRKKKLDIAAGTHFSMSQLISELVDNEVPDTLVFSSKFVKNPSQIRKFELFVKGFKERGVQNILLVTKYEANFQDKDITVEHYDNVYSGTIPPHDRYFAFKSNGVWHRYKMTAELDQCRYEHLSEATEHTPGIWNDISFIEIVPEVFPQKLNEKLNIMEEVYYL